MKFEFILAVVFSVLIFTFSLALLGLNHTTEIFAGYEAMIDMLCMLLFGVSSIVFLRKGRAKVKAAEKNQAEF